MSATVPDDDAEAPAISFVRLGTADTVEGSAARWTTVDVGTLTGADPDENTDAPRWVLPGLLEHGSRLLVAGDEGVGKSLLIQQWMTRLAAGLPCLPGEPPAGPLRCLVIDTELNERTARRRLRPMARAAGLQPGHLLYVLAPAGIDLLRDDERAALQSIIARFRPHVVAIDSLYRAFNGDPDDPRIGGQVQRVVDTIRVSTGAAIIIACHYRKRATDGRQRRSLDDLAGSRVWKAWPETAVDVTRDRLRILKDREGLSTELTIERLDAGQWENDPDGWPFALAATDAGPTTWHGHTVIQPYALGVLARSDTPLSTTRVTELIGEDRAIESKQKFHRSNVSAALGELLDKHPPHVTKHPGARGANDWTITPTGLEAISTDAKDTPE